MDETKVYTIAAKFLRFNQAQKKRLWELIDAGISKDDTKADLRLTAVRINNTTEFEEDQEFSDKDFANYRGYIMHRPVHNYMHVIVSYGIFPTKLFKAIENQFPDVTISFVASSDNFAASYKNYELDPHSRIVVPEMVWMSVPYADFRMNESVLHSISHHFNTSDLEGKILVCKLLEDELPSEHPRKSSYYNPYTIRDEELKISNELAQKYFPNLRRPERKQSVSPRSEGNNTHSAIQPQTPSLPQQPKKSGSVVMKILKWIFISIGVIIALFILWFLSLFF